MTNTTNGEMIKQLFPSCVVVVVGPPFNKVGFKTLDGSPNDYDYVWYPTSWWNATYKVGKVRKICGNELPI